MIKVNLIGEARRPAAAARPGVPSERDFGQLLLIVGLVLGLLITGGHWWWVRSASKKLDEEITEARREVERLAEVIREVEEFEAKQAELEHKIEVIETLRANQRGPVQVMDHVSRSLPELLWLTKLELRGNTVVLNGEAFNTTSIATFIENLDKVPEFQEPVLRDVTRRGQTYNYSIEAGFVPAALQARLDGDGLPDGDQE